MAIEKILAENQTNVDHTILTIKPAGLMCRRPSLIAVFLSAVSLIRGPKTAFFEEPMPQFKSYIGLFIRGFVIHGPTFEERIYRE
jgi:hypothetical protein